MTTHGLVVIICAAIHIVCVNGFQADEIHLPSYLERPIHESITAINLLLDTAQEATHARQLLALNTLLEISRAIGYDGPLEDSLKVDRFVFGHFLVDRQTIYNKLSSDVTHRFREASSEVATGLRRLLSACEVDAVIDDIECLLDTIAGNIAQKTAVNDEQCWGLYEEASDGQLQLHCKKCLSVEEYKKRLEEILLCGTSTVNRLVNSHGSSLERYLAKVADSVRSILREALLPLCKPEKC